MTAASNTAANAARGAARLSRRRPRNLRAETWSAPGGQADQSSEGWIDSRIVSSSTEFGGDWRLPGPTRRNIFNEPAKSFE